MCSLFVDDAFYTYKCGITSVLLVGPRGVIIKTCVAVCGYSFENYTIYAFVNLWDLHIYPRLSNGYLHDLFYQWLTIIHLTPYIVSLKELQKTLGLRGLFCTLEDLDVLRKWRQTTM
jgi:hypothetical protein